jgi:hypothetical protein
MADVAIRELLAARHTIVEVRRNLARPLPAAALVLP